MKIKCLLLMVFTLAICACGGRSLATDRKTQMRNEDASLSQMRLEPLSGLEQEEARILLAELAELERGGIWIQGLALREAGIREKSGDYAGAVAAAYKEMSMAYGKGLVQKKDIEQGLQTVLVQAKEDSIVVAAESIIAFINEEWDIAHKGLVSLFDELEDPDGFGRWMILVCVLEKNPDDRQAVAAYRSIRARYSNFPEFWYRGARAFYGLIAADYAERCVNSAPQGPFAGECRKMLAARSGLKSEDAQYLRTKIEIEAIISHSLSVDAPQLLNDLIPLLSLPENPYTVFAVEALKTLSSTPKFRNYFNEQAVSSSWRSLDTKRLTDRLSYIYRG